MSKKAPKVGSKQTAKAGKSASKKRPAAPRKAPKNDAQAFLDLMHEDKTLQRHMKKGWQEIVQIGKKRGFEFTPQELYKQMKKRYAISKPPLTDDPDTCICFK
ncbi:MAG TPA: Nif11-like leader peptide family natural product precursor [Blastocatellia bacterium]|nr:Nif11-like leader peptide family natural product precursor [Blastocatellia bacterium]